MPVLRTRRRNPPPSSLSSTWAGRSTAAFSAADECLGGGHGLTTLTATPRDVEAPRSARVGALVVGEGLAWMGGRRMWV